MKKIVILTSLIILVTFAVNPAWATVTDYDQTCLAELESDATIIVADSVTFTNNLITVIFPDGKKDELNYKPVSKENKLLIEKELHKGSSPIATTEIISNKRTISLTFPSNWNEKNETVSCKSIVL